MALVWVTWLMLGSCFYMHQLDMTFALGFYMAVNVGYSIGWGDINEKNNLGSQWFSCVYILIGASFASCILGKFAQNIVVDKDNWYEQEKENERYAQETKRSGLLKRIYLFLKFNKDKLRAILVWVAFIATATGCAWATNKEWNFINALYFAISSLSTGGLFALPGGPGVNDEWKYGLTGLYAAFGVPIMGLAMGTLASFFISSRSIDDTLNDIKAPITEEEIKMLTEFKLANTDGEIDKSEFIILCMVRTGAATPGLLKLMVDYFDELDVDHSKSLSMAEILKFHESGQADAAATKLHNSVINEKDDDFMVKLTEDQKVKRNEKYNINSQSVETKIDVSLSGTARVGPV